MSQIKVWVGGGVIVAILGLVGLSALMAQRNAPPGANLGGSEVGRYQVVHTSPDGMILLDTATGDLFRATANDVKPYFARQRGDDRERPRPFVDKDRPPLDGNPFGDVRRKDRIPPTDKDKDKDRPAKDKDLFKDRPSFDKDKAKDKE